MNMHRLTVNCSIILSLMTGAAVAGADTFVREITREFNAQPGQKLAIDVGSGQIEVQAGDASEVVVEVLMSVKTADEAAAGEIFDNTLLEFSENASEISLKTGRLKKKAISWFGLKRSKLPQTQVIATCPPNFNLSLDTGSGSIVVSGVTGQVILDTGSGGIHGSNLGGSVSADTGSGSINLQNVAGDLIADTGSGGISASGLIGTFSGDTGSGTIQASGQISQFTADTGSGGINIQSSISLSGSSSADTGSGSIDIQLPANSSFSFTAKSRSGSDCAFPGTTITDKGKRFLNGFVGENGPELILDAGSGGIQIHPID